MKIGKDIELRDALHDVSCQLRGMNSLDTPEAAELLRYYDKLYSQAMAASGNDSAAVYEICIRERTA